MWSSCWYCCRHRQAGAQGGHGSCPGKFSGWRCLVWSTFSAVCSSDKQLFLSKWWHASSSHASRERQLSPCAPYWAAYLLIASVRTTYLKSGKSEGIPGGRKEAFLLRCFTPCRLRMTRLTRARLSIPAPLNIAIDMDTIFWYRMLFQGQLHEVVS